MLRLVGSSICSKHRYGLTNLCARRRLIPARQCGAQQRGTMRQSGGRLGESCTRRCRTWRLSCVVQWHEGLGHPFPSRRCAWQTARGHQGVLRRLQILLSWRLQRGGSNGNTYVLGIQRGQQHLQDTTKFWPRMPVTTCRKLEEFSNWM